MLINSPECLPLVPEAVVCNTGVKSLFSHQKAVCTQSVIDAHTDHWRALLNAILDDEGKIVPPVRATAHVKATAMDPESNGKVCIGRNASGANHIEEKAVLSNLIANVISTVPNTRSWISLCRLGAVEGSV